MKGYVLFDNPFMTAIETVPFKPTHTIFPHASIGYNGLYTNLTGCILTLHCPLWLYTFNCIFTTGPCILTRTLFVVPLPTYTEISIIFLLQYMVQVETINLEFWCAVLTWITPADIPLFSSVLSPLTPSLPPSCGCLKCITNTSVNTYCPPIGTAAVLICGKVQASHDCCATVCI